MTEHLFQVTQRRCFCWELYAESDTFTSVDFPWWQVSQATFFWTEEYPLDSLLSYMYVLSYCCFILV